MAITYGFFNAIQGSDGTYDRTYNADQMSTYFEGLVSDGVYADVGDGMQVKAGSGMQVQINSGRLLIDCKWLKNTAAYPITINTAHVTLNRYTAIVARLDYNARTITFATKDGTPASTPTKPTITRSQTVKELCLAYVYVGKGVTNITQANIQDVRANNDVCGWVTGLIDQLDTSQLFIQFEAACMQQLADMANWQKQQEAKFNTWFNSLTEQLNVNTYIQKYHKVVEMGASNGVFPLDMAGYSYSSDDIMFINVNGVILVENYDYLLDTSKTPVEIHTNANLDKDNILEITVLKSKIGQN